MKHEKNGIAAIVVVLGVLLIVSIRSTMASVTDAGPYSIAHTVSPAGGGGPGPVDNWFTYQGYVEDNNVPVNGNCDFRFSLWDSSGSAVPPTGGIQIGATQTALNIPVVNGLFSYPINSTDVFGDDAFNGQRRYLQIAARCPTGGGAYTTLAPRQLLTASPYALSLRPGATISATQNNALLTVINTLNSDTHGSAISARGRSPTAPVIAAYHEGTGHALYGSSTSGYPTVGGINYGSGSGVDGRSTSGIGVYGYTSNTSGIGTVGLQTGYSTSDLGSYWEPGGFFGGRNGVAGITKADTGYGVLGWDKSASGGVAGRFISDNGWAGSFSSSSGNGVYISAPNVGLNVAAGTKNAVVPTEDGSRLMYSEESTEVWFSDYGFGQLQDGRAVIAIDTIFAQTVNLDKPYHVFLQVYDDAELYVTERTTTGFEVHLRDGVADAEFSYRIVAQRLGHEDARLERAPWADNDPNLYPDQAGETGMWPQGGE